jgi:hypothetical protein
LSGYSRPCNVLKANERPGSVPGAWHRLVRLFASIDLAPHLVPGTDLSACLLASTWPRTWCLAPIWLPAVPGTDLSHRFVRQFASIRPGVAPGAWHQSGRLFASIDLASHLVPGTDLSASLLASDLASHRVPGTDLAACLLASDLASHLVPGTDLSHRFVRQFASIRPGVAPGAWHRFVRLFLASDLASHRVPGTDLAAPLAGLCLLVLMGSGRRPKLRWSCCTGCLA